jgi:GNAT superfamily N-acetyltransferase
MALSLPLAERSRSTADVSELRSLAAADAQSAADVIRTAFAAQSRPTNPPSSALRETAETIAAKIAAGGGFGVFADARLVAVALWLIDGGALLVGRVCALPERRGRGSSRRLLAACESIAKAHGLKQMRLRVRLELPENERLFQGLGFARVRVEAHPGFDAPTTVVMERRLS